MPLKYQGDGYCGVACGPSVNGMDDYGSIDEAYVDLHVTPMKETNPQALETGFTDHRGDGYRGVAHDHHVKWWHDCGGVEEADVDLHVTTFKETNPLAQETGFTDPRVHKVTKKRVRRLAEVPVRGTVGRERRSENFSYLMNKTRVLTRDEFLYDEGIHKCPSAHRLVHPKCSSCWQLKDGRSTSNDV